MIKQCCDEYPCGSLHLLFAFWQANCCVWRGRVRGCARVLGTITLLKCLPLMFTLSWITEQYYCEIQGTMSDSGQYATFLP